MSFGLTTSKSTLIASSTGALHDFSVATTIKSVRLTNNGAAPVSVTLWFDYDGTSTGDVDCVAKIVTIEGYASLVLDGGPWHFAASSRISGLATVNNIVTCHITPATI